jgi:membrane fusion protein, heavy metal efflux system
MKNIVALSLALSIFNSGCNNHEHTHDSDDAEMEALAYTLYTEKTELFVEFKPLVVGTEARFAAHFTQLGEVFKPFTEGTIHLTLEVNGQKTSIKQDSLKVPGIFRLRLVPLKTGVGRLVFDIQTKQITDRIIIDNVQVFPDENSARAANPPGEEDPNNISFLKEQAWKIEFANTAARKQPFREVIRASGQILSAPGDELMVVAKSGGIVRFTGKTTLGAEVSEGESMFSISGADFTERNIDVLYKEAKSSYEKSKADYERAQELIKDKLITQQELLQRKSEYQVAEAQFNSIAKNYGGNGLKVSTPIKGFIKNIFVKEGQYVNPGEPLASVSQNRRLVLKAEVSQKYYPRLASIKAANFQIGGAEKAYSTEDLNGKLLSYGKSVSGGELLIPITFEIDNKEQIIPGEFVQVYLLSDPHREALVIPLSAVLEELGSHYIYVQVEGESFQKRRVTLGSNDGLNTTVLSGVKEGERVVTKGAYDIKLATMSGSMPAHGHEH